MGTAAIDLDKLRARASVERWYVLVLTCLIYAINIADRYVVSTVLEPTEIITKISFPIPKKAAYQKFRNQASRFALVGVFVAKRGSEIRVAVTGAGSNGVFRVASFEEALKKRFSPKSLEGLTIPADGMNADIHGSAEYRAHLVGVLARRAVADAIGKPIA